VADRSELAIFQRVGKYGADVEGVSIEAWSAVVDETSRIAAMMLSRREAAGHDRRRSPI
jgi:hypothetical protein